MKLTLHFRPDRRRELERLVRGEYDRMYRFALFRTASEEDAQDLVQEVLLHLLGDTDALAGIGNLRAYVYRALSNECLRFCQRRKVFPQAGEEEIPDRPDGEDSWQQEYERVRRMLGRIPAEQAEAICLHTVDGMRFAEIADMLELPLSTVKSRFQRGVERVRDLLKQEKLLDEGKENL